MIDRCVPDVLFLDVRDGRSFVWQIITLRPADLLQVELQEHVARYGLTGFSHQMVLNA